MQIFTVIGVQCGMRATTRLLLQAGTYIKEFVHSDEGRTQPHLASLLALDDPAKILQLDVNQIHIDFLDATQHADTMYNEAWSQSGQAVCI